MTYDFNYLIYSTEFTEMIAHINSPTVQFARQNRIRADPVSPQNKTRKQRFYFFAEVGGHFWRSFDNKMPSRVNFVLKVVKLHFLVV